jgi:hypothetical protein
MTALSHTRELKTRARPNSLSGQNRAFFKEKGRHKDGPLENKLSDRVP